MSDELDGTQKDGKSAASSGKLDVTSGSEKNSSASATSPHPDTVHRQARSVHSETLPGREAQSSGAFSSQTRQPKLPRETSRQTSSRTSAPRARRMNLSLVRVDVWSVAKVTFLLSVAGGIIQVIAFALLWTMLNAVGVFDQVTQIFSSTGLDAGDMNLSDILSLSKVLSAVTIFSIGEVIIFTLLATIFALLYNAISALVGGVHVTLGDD